MKIFTLKEKANFQDSFGEYVLGPNELGNEIGYIAWGEIGPGVEKRLEPGVGHEEIILVLQGEAAVRDGGSIVTKGRAFYLPSGASVKLTAGPDGCTYVSAGAHVKAEGHEH